jgi:hypothetical protein
MTATYKPIILAINLFFTLSLSISAASGDLDPTFGNSGKLTNRMLGHSRDDANGVAIQSAGKTLVAESGLSTKGSATEATHTSYSSLPMAGVTDGAVYAIAISGSNVYVGGSFNNAGDISANYIAKWDGTTWSTLGSGMNGFVLALAIAGNGDLYAGGNFSTAGGVSANRVARWDGSTWSPVGSGTNGTVRDLEISGTDVYASGDFTAAGGGSASKIAKWDGSGWSALGSGMNDRVTAIALSGSGDLYAGGRFTTAGGVPANKIAKWNGSGWSALGSGVTSGIQSQVNAIAVSGSTVYAGGFFTFAGGLPANNIAMWNGLSWSPLGSGIVGAVDALAVSESGTLYVGGDFISAGEMWANNIASWNGSSWSTLGSGVNSSGGNWVLALAISGNGNVYAGGFFTTAGNRAANNIAVWNGTGWAALKPCTAATMTVSNNNDSGAGSLRDAIAHICPGGTISFDPGAFTAPQTITLTSGELFIDTDMTIQGPGANLLSISGNNASRVVYVGEGITAKLDGVTIRDGNADDGAGITNSGNLTLSNSMITRNAAAWAGGIRNFNTLTVINSVMSGNTAVQADGGFGNNGTMTVITSTISGNKAGGAGGIWNGGSLALTGSTISGNTADGGGDGYYDPNGGGIYNEGGTAFINNSTMSGNGATKGGGIYNTYGWDDNGGTVYLTNLTVSGNVGGGIFSDGSSETLTNTIVASNTGGDISGTIETAGHSLVGDAASAGGIQNGVDGNVVGVAPLLGPLRNNGGPTMTHALLAGSPAINAGNNCVLKENGCGYTHPALPTDQRGFPRFGTVDIGAFEVTPTPTCGNPIDCPDFFIGQQYRDFLNRESEASGLHFYLDILNGCNPNDAECIRYTRGALAANFFRSPEFQAKGSYVMYLYMVTIGQRAVTAADLQDPSKVERPHYAEFIADMRAISGPDDRNGPDPAMKAALTQEFVQRAEIVAKYPTSTYPTLVSFGNALATTAGVTLSSETQNLIATATTRAQVLQIIAESAEVNAAFYQPAFVTMEYFGYLRREPENCHDPANWFGTGDPNACGYIFHNHRFHLSDNADLIQNFIVRGFIESAEYRGRFGLP